MSPTEPRYDLAVFGATGFTGGLTAAYLAEHAPQDLRWAVAGRSRPKLERLRARLSGARRPPSGLIVADAATPPTLDPLASSTRVLLSCVGPFDELGGDVVRACLRQRTAYCDVAGEAGFVDRIAHELHAEAAARGVRIVPACGFDAVPHDLGVLFTLEHLPSGVPVKVEGFVRMRANVSGGTWQSAVRSLGTVRQVAAWRRRHPIASPPGRRIRAIRPHIRWEREIRGWACPLPTVDTRVILRSARLLTEYGPDFRYGHYLRIQRFATVVGGGAALGALFSLAQVPPTRDLLLRLREPGDGPSEARRARGWFRVTFVGRGGGRTVLSEVTGGDPGYEESSKMAAEAALLLVRGDGALPRRYGVLTPASAMGHALLERLQDRGVGFRVVRSGTPEPRSRRFRLRR